MKHNEVDHLRIPRKLPPPMKKLHDGSMDAANDLTGGGFHAADVFRRLEELGI